MEVPAQGPGEQMTQNMGIHGVTHCTSQLVFQNAYLQSKRTNDI